MHWDNWFILKKCLQINWRSMLKADSREFTISGCITLTGIYIPGIFLSTEDLFQRDLRADLLPYYLVLGYFTTIVPDIIYPMSETNFEFFTGILVSTLRFSLNSLGPTFFAL